MKTDTSKIERAKVLKAVRDILPKPQSSLDALRQLAGDPEIERSIDGLRQEDEFALLCRLMGTATHCVHLEQRPVIPGDSLPPDFLSRFLPGYSLLGDEPVPTRSLRCFIEVKSTVFRMILRERVFTSPTATGSPVFARCYGTTTSSWRVPD